jgi:2-oxoglutarate ferredoxin oxidoreductase subunit gamma
MLERILIAGSGGQGIVLAGRILATAAIRSVRHVTFLPAYGAEVRGGLSSCQVILSDREIASPIAEELETVILMTPGDSESLPARLKPNGLLLVNTSLCALPAGRTAVALKATDLADGIGDTRVANLIMLGALLRHKPLVTADCVKSVLRDIFAAKHASIVERNLKAFELGLRNEP